MNKKSELTIILPKFYNNNKKVEKSKFNQTFDELLSLFGAYTIDQNLSGVWKDGSGKVYRDQNIRITIILDKINTRTLSELKENLKLRFDQKDIFITITTRNTTII